MIGACSSTPRARRHGPLREPRAPEPATRTPPRPSASGGSACSPTARRSGSSSSPAACASTYANAEGSRLLGDGVIGGLRRRDARQRRRRKPRSLRAAIDAVAEGRAARRPSCSLADRATTAGSPGKACRYASPGPRLPMAFASTLDITDLKQAQAALARQATHDPLTGLPNRRLLIDALIDALR